MIIIIYYIFIVTKELCLIIAKFNDKKYYEKILDSLITSIKKKINTYNENQTYLNLSIIKNYIMFFMILFLNIKQSLFVQTVFIGENLFFKSFVNIINNIKSKKSKKFLFSLINNIFLGEYKNIFFKSNKERDVILEQIFIESQTDFSCVFCESEATYNEDTYKKMFEILSDFDLSYENFFNNQTEIKENDISAIKLSISQSIIRVAFSKEKSKYLKNNNEKEKYFEYYFIKKVIEKDMENTVKKFGDEYKTLFRKEDLCDDILKYMFFIFGNNMVIDSFVKPLKNILKKRGYEENIINSENLNDNDENITKEEYEILMDEMINKLQLTIPLVLKVLLKILYNSVQKYFTIEKNNYNPLYTSLIFNFIISPRVQLIYNINSIKSLFVRSLNRLLRNTCFNFKFDNNDPLSPFNELIEKNNKKLQKFIKDNILSINDNDDKIKDSLRNMFTEKYLLYPKFLFYYDSELLCNTINGGAEKIIDFQEIKFTENDKE